MHLLIRKIIIFAIVLTFSFCQSALAERSQIESDLLTIPRVDIDGALAYELVFRIESGDEFLFVLDQANDPAEDTTGSGTYNSIAQTLQLDQVELENGEVYSATLELVSDSPEVDFRVQSVDLVYTALTNRGGVRPETTDGVPHFQISAEPVPDVVTEMYRRIFSLPGLEQRATSVSGTFSGSQDMWVNEDIEIIHPEVSLLGQPIGHIHPDSTMHLSLDPLRAADAVDARWAVFHPNAAQEGWEGYILIYAPRFIHELDSIFQIITDSYNYLTGQNFQATDYY
ncbi:MAG: hypothetical protein GKR91_09080 [Pseudomonadales bacterium]|nr:hypothetical protein [Pseudomonadales bacterium]